ncbi:MAG: mandelate racemase/muconate lactonizing enzyme family protein [Trueperaceae bacterium]
MSPLISDVFVSLVNAAPFTNWVFLTLETDTGKTGIGEATLSGNEGKVRDRVDQLRHRLLGQDAFEVRVDELAEDEDMLSATVRSALDQALWDLKAAHFGVPLWRLLNGSGDPIPLYANINRASLEREPAAMARIARRAVEAGFGGVKCAPLDGLDRQNCDSGSSETLLAEALERVSAIRVAIGPEAHLMVDCHWRLSPEWARKFVDGLAPLGLTWLEDPFPEEAEEEWLSLKEYCDISLAGGERATTLAQLNRSLSIGQYDICCPDVRHVGGVEALWHAAHLAHAAGVEFAPHNPRGPVGTIASAHVCSASPSLMFLEFPFAECDWRSQLVTGAEQIEGGVLTLPQLPGSGAPLDAHIVQKHPFRPRLAPREESKVDIW